MKKNFLIYCLDFFKFSGPLWFCKMLFIYFFYFSGLNIFCYIDVPLPSGQKERWYVELERDVYNKESLRIPMLEDGRGPADEEEEISRFPAKAYNHLDFNLAAKFTVVKTEAGERDHFLHQI